MDFELRHRPSFALLDVDLSPGDAVTAEAGALVSHSAGVDVETNRGGGGLLQNVKRSILGGESFFRNTFRSDDGGHATFAPPLPGDVVHVGLQDERINLQSGAYLAADAELDVDTSVGGARTFFGGEGFFLLSVIGTGSLWFTSYGAIERVELSEGETYTVDTGHVVAFEESVSYDVRRVGGLKSTLFSGEGLVGDLTGPGSVWLQTRSHDALVRWMTEHMPTTSGSDGGIRFDIDPSTFGGGRGGRGGNI